MASQLLELTEAELLFAAAAAMGPEIPAAASARVTNARCEQHPQFQHCGIVVRLTIEEEDQWAADGWRALTFPHCPECGRQMTLAVSLPTPSSLPCPFCPDPINHNDAVCMVPLRGEDGRLQPGPGFIPAHSLCAISAKGGVSDMQPRIIKRGPCQRCSLDYEEHYRGTGGTYCAETGDAYVAVPSQAAA